MNDKLGEIYVVLVSHLKKEVSVPSGFVAEVVTRIGKALG